MMYFKMVLSCASLVVNQVGNEIGEIYMNATSQSQVQSQGLSQSHAGKLTIVGAGIVGLSAAIELQREGFNVTVIDKEGAGAGASKGNAGHFATEQVFP